MSARILVTGSRNWNDRDTIREELTRIAHSVGYSAMLVVHGECPEGADFWANEWTIDLKVDCERHPAIWRPNGVYDPAAGFRRNAEMVDLGANLVLAFMRPCSDPKCKRKTRHTSHGATDTAHRSVVAGLSLQTWFQP